MKKLGLLVALAMIAGSASATLVLSDADWAGTYKYTDGGTADSLTGAGILNSVVDGAGSGDVAITVTVDALHDGGGFLYGIVFAMTDLAVPAAGDVWSVRLENLGAYANVMLCALVDGGTYVQNDGVVAVFDQAIGGTEPQVQMASFDLSGHTTIESVGMLVFAPEAALGGPQATIAVPEPATLGLFSVFAGAALFIRKKFMV